MIDNDALRRVAHTFNVVVEMPLPIADRVWLLRQSHQAAGVPDPGECLTEQLVKLGTVRTVEALFSVPGFDSKRLSNLCCSLIHKGFRERFAILLAELNDLDVPVEQKPSRHPLGPGRNCREVAESLLLEGIELDILPVELPGFPLSCDSIVDHQTALQLQRIPRRVVIIGGGYVAVELALSWATEDRKVMMTTAYRTPLAGFIPSRIKKVTTALNEKGVGVITDAQPIRATEHDGGLRVEMQRWDGVVMLAADLVVMASRIPCP